MQLLCALSAPQLHYFEWWCSVFERPNHGAKCVVSDNDYRSMYDVSRKLSCSYLSAEVCGLSEKIGNAGL